MSDDQPGIPELNTSKPNVARIWDVQLGGKDNFAADRNAAVELNKACKKAGAPGGAAVAHETRAWLYRAVRLLVERGIAQFIDLGVGYPASRGNVHEFAQRLNPDARTVYVDNDRIVLVHGRALLADNHATIAIQGDLRDPETILRDAELRSLLELDRPVAVLIVAVLDLLPDEEAITSIITRIREAVAPGSYLAFTHTTSDNHPDAAAALVNEYARLDVNTPMVPRAAKEIHRFFDGWELVEPGLVPPAQWHPELADQHGGSLAPETGWTYAGMGYLAPQQPDPLSTTAVPTKSARNTDHKDPAGWCRRSTNRAGNTSHPADTNRAAGHPARAGHLGAIQTHHEGALMLREDRS